MAIDEKYASPALRLALFREDYPMSPPPKFRLVPWAVLTEKFDLPAGWAKDEYGSEVTEAVLCTLDYGDGRPVVESYKEVPQHVKEHGKKIEFEQNLENFEKLCTKAQGRALKRAGYPDRSPDLAAVVHWRKRAIENQQLAAGAQPVAELEPGPDPIEQAGSPGSDDDVTDGELLPMDGAPIEQPAAPTPPAQPTSGESWVDALPADMAEVVRGLTVAGRDEVHAFLVGRNLLGQPISDLAAKTLGAYITSRKKAPSAKAQGVQEPLGAPDTPAGPETTTTAPAGPESGTSGPTAAGPAGCAWCGKPIGPADSVVMSGALTVHAECADEEREAQAELAAANG